MGARNKPSRSTFSLSSSGQATEFERRSEVELSDATDVEKLMFPAHLHQYPPHYPPQYGGSSTGHGSRSSPDSPGSPSNGGGGGGGRRSPGGGGGGGVGGTGGLPANDLFQPRSVKFWMILLSNFLALFLVALDRTIVATAVPRISDEFHSLGDIGWYASAYMLTTSASQLLFGRLYKFYSMKWTFLACVVVFEIGSAICGAAPSSGIFIVGRAVAGVASAGIFSGCMLIMVPMIPLHKRPMFQGLFGVVFGVASVVGPLVGGAFTGSVSWRWCFYINLPVGGFTLLFMMFFWRPPPQKHMPATLWEQVKRLDPLGTLFFLPGIVCLLLALQWGGSTYAWTSWRIIPLFILFGALMAAFTVVQITMPETATLPGRVIGQRSVLSGALFTFFISAAMLMLVYFVPIWFQTAKRVDPLNSGVYTIPLVLSLVVSSILSGIVTQKIGYYVPSMILAPCVMSVGEGLMSTFTPTTGSAHWIAFQFVSGFGLGFGMQIGNLAAQTVLPPEDISTGVAIMFFVQQLGGAVFTTVGQALLSNLLVSQLRARLPAINPSDIINAGATELASVVPPEFLPLVTDAYNYACTRIFLTAMGLSLCALVCALFMEWRSIKKPPGAPGGPPAPRAASAGSRRPGLRGPSGPGIPAGLGRPQMIEVTPKYVSAYSPPSPPSTPPLAHHFYPRDASVAPSATTAVGTSTDGGGGGGGASYYKKKRRLSAASYSDGPEHDDRLLRQQHYPPGAMEIGSSPPEPDVDPKILRARQEAEEKLRQARRESDPNLARPRRNSVRLSKTYKRNSGLFE